MSKKRNLEYANREIKLAKSYLETNPENEVQKDRLAWWSAYLGDYETAKEFAVSDSVKEYIEVCERS